MSLNKILRVITFSHLLANMKMSRKLGFGFGVMLALLIAVMLLSRNATHHVINGYENMHATELAIDEHIKDVNALMLQCRRNEKDFLMRKDEKYYEALHHTHDKMLASSSAALEIAKNKGLSEIQQQIENINSYANDYEESVHAVVELWKEMGLDHNSGLQGQFRDVVHELEDDLAEHQVEYLYPELLLIRRWEKDFIRTGEDKYKERLNNAIASYKQQLQDSHCDQESKETQLEAIEAYSKAWQGLLALKNAEKVEAEESAAPETATAENETAEPETSELAASDSPANESETTKPETNEAEASEVAVSDPIGDAYEVMRQQAHIIEDSLKSIIVPNNLALMLEMRKHEKDYLLRRDQKYVDTLAALADKFRKAIKDSEISQEHSDSMLALIDKYQQSFNQLVAEDKALDTNTATMRQAVHNIEDAIAPIVEKVNAMAKAKENNVLQDSNRQLSISFIIGIVATVIGIILCLLITRIITRPLKRGVAFAKTIADGDLTGQIDIDTADELGDLCRAINKMAESLRSTMTTLRSNADTLAGSATELSATASQLASGAEEMSGQSASVSAAAEEMSVNMNNMAGSTEQMSGNIRTVVAAVEQMTASVSEIAQNAEQAAGVADEAYGLATQSNEKIDQLGSAADAIGKVIEVIQDIAEQTNLLALNATIEAARAGDAGKGFAVVANEVKELAKQTAEATSDISQRIGAIQSTTAESVDSIGKISVVIKKVNDVSRSIASAVEQQSATTREIAQNISNVSSVSETVTKSINESASASQEITKNIAGIDEAARQTAESSAQTQIAGNELSKLSEQMNLLVGNFKV